MKTLALLSALLLAPLAILHAEPLLEKVDVFPAGMNGIARYRIPGIVVTKQGTVLAYSEARKNDSSDWGEIEVQLRRSTDGGKTWKDSQHIAHLGERLEGNPHKKDTGAHEQTVNNPVAIVDRETGSIEFLYCINYAHCFSMHSTDDGVTWSKPVDITASFEPFRKHYDWKVIATGQAMAFKSRVVDSSFPSGWPMARKAITVLPLRPRFIAMIMAKHGRLAISLCRTKASSAIPMKPCSPSCLTVA